jgi:type II secretory pathway pseudopilin PulG
MVIANSRIKGSTLIESVISMTLVLLIAALVFSFFIRINTKNRIAVEMEAFLLSKMVLSNLNENREYNSEKYTINGFLVNKKVIELDTYKGVYFVTVEISNKNNTIIHSCNSIISEPALIHIDNSR